MDIYNKLCPELQVIIQKKYQRILLHDRLKHAQKYLKYFVTPGSGRFIGGVRSGPFSHANAVDQDINIYSFSTARTHFTINTSKCVTYRNPLYDLVILVVKTCNIADPENVVISTQLFNLNGYVEYFRCKYFSYSNSNPDVYNIKYIENRKKIDRCIKEYIKMLQEGFFQPN